ncbi:unnamed protein product [Urochloa decumbens]|uniref:Uncharacterized protein n=1 Tax=Urochloa decumbens TaxID=240449 RepID=A0ABC8WUP0_9POAL
MTRIVHYLIAASFVVLVMISSNSSSCQACIGPWCRRPRPCFEPTNDDYCTDDICQSVCDMNGFKTNRAYCKQPKKVHDDWLCCCPPAR